MANISSGMGQGMGFVGALLAGVIGVFAITALLPDILSNLNTSIASLTTYSASAGSLASVTWILIPFVIFGAVGYMVATKIRR